MANIAFNVHSFSSYLFTDKIIETERSILIFTMVFVRIDVMETCVIFLQYLPLLVTKHYHLSHNCRTAFIPCWNNWKATYCFKKKLHFQNCFSGTKLNVIKLIYGHSESVLFVGKLRIFPINFKTCYLLVPSVFLSFAPSSAPMFLLSYSPSFLPSCPPCFTLYSRQRESDIHLPTHLRNRTFWNTSCTPWFQTAETRIWTDDSCPQTCRFRTKVYKRESDLEAISWSLEKQWWSPLTKWTCTRRRSSNTTQWWMAES